jgi:hypothetical protein
MICPDDRDFALVGIVSLVAVAGLGLERTALHPSVFLATGCHQSGRSDPRESPGRLQDSGSVRLGRSTLLSSTESAAQRP